LARAWPPGGWARPPESIQERWGAASAVFGERGYGDGMARKYKRKRAPARRRQPDPRVERVAGPKTRLRSLFALLHDVITTADRTLLGTENLDKPVVRIDLAVLQRGINALKAVRLLAENGHWEFAASATRQLFELVVNMEYLGMLPDRDQEAFRYAKFGLLQTVQAAHREALYDKKMGRAVDEQRLARIESMLKRSFPEFRPSGGARWQQSWSGENTWQLAELSENPLRVDQYNQLFKIWSEETHATPGALIESFTAQAGENWPADVVARDEVRMVEMVTIAISLFLEVWVLLPHVPTLEVAKFKAWTDGLIVEASKHGAPAPPSVEIPNS
jgi:hypothetical protein